MKGERTIHRRVLEYAYMDTDALYRDFHIPEQGYDEEQAEESRQRYGSNVLSGRASDTVLYRLRRAFINPFAVILFVLASISFVTDVLLASNFSRDMTTVIIILSMLLISGGVRFVQEMRAKRVADRLTEMIASEVLVYRDGQWVGLSSTELVVGDTVRLLAGDRVPGGYSPDGGQGSVRLSIGDHRRECHMGETGPSPSQGGGALLWRV